MATQEDNANLLGLPDILPDIYRASSSLDAVKKHIETLEKEVSQNPGNMNAMLIKNAFEQYHHYIFKLSDRNRQYFNLIHQQTVKNHSSLYIKTTARKKSLISFYDKCRRKLFDGSPLDSIKDIYACRTIIGDSSLDSEEVIKLCYTIMDETITQMIALGFTPCGATDLKDIDDFNPELYPNVVIPQQSYLSEENLKYVKDYILHPKDNGYQSLHVAFRDKYGRFFEYQVRTYLMDHHAEHGKAAHDIYEQARKKDIPTLKIDRTKVHMSFYIYMYDQLSDDACLEVSSSCLLRTHHVLT